MEIEEDWGDAGAGHGKHYKWLLLVGQQWLSVDHDHVIEAHYCQPGAKGITLNTHHGQVFINFDMMHTPNAGMKVQRQVFLPPGETEDIGWYFRADQLWQEYGTPSSNNLASTVRSRDVERHFTLDPQGSFNFTVGSTTYTLNFSTMTQRNCTSGLSRGIRRRPKLSFNSASLNSAMTPVLYTSTTTDDGYKWEFMGNEGEWTEYRAHVCSYDSVGIEQQYQLNPQGQLHFNTRRFSYTLDFSAMCQTNNNTFTTRAVRRTLKSGRQQHSSMDSQPRWQFADNSGIWKDYTAARSGQSSQDIELQYQQDPTGTVRFTTNSFQYELNFAAMTQRNLSTNKIRSVRRLNP